MSQKHPQTAVTEPEIQEKLAVFTSLAAVAAINYVSRQPSNARGRKRAPQSAFRVQARNRRKVRNEILHHQPGWKGCSSISLRGMGADRGEAGGPLELQSYEEKVFEPHQLLRPGSGDGQPGPAAASGAAARRCGDQGRSGGCGPLEAPGSAEHRALQE